MTTRKPLSEAARLDFQALAERIQTHKGINGHKPLSNNRIAEKDDIKKGAFHKWLGKKPDSPITNADIEKGLKSNDAHVRKMAQFAKNMRESVRAALRLPIAERFYIVSDKGAVLEDNGGHGFESIEEAKRWFGQQTKILGRLGIGAPDAQRFGQAVRAGTELVGEATDIDLSGFASDKTEPLKALLKSHGVEHEIQGSKLHLHNSEDAHFVVDAMADIEAGHTPPATEAEDAGPALLKSRILDLKNQQEISPTSGRAAKIKELEDELKAMAAGIEAVHTPPTTEAREGEYEVAYVDNNGRMKRKSFKTDAAREKWITDQGSDIEVDSYRDPEPASKTERADPGSFPKGGDSLTLDQWKNAILSIKPSALFDPSGGGCEAWEDPARTIPLGYWGSPEYENEWLIDMTGYGEGISGAVERQGRQEGSRSNSANRIMRGKGYKQVGEAGDLPRVKFDTIDDFVDYVSSKWPNAHVDIDERPKHRTAIADIPEEDDPDIATVSYDEHSGFADYYGDDDDADPLFPEHPDYGDSASSKVEAGGSLSTVSLEDLWDELIRRTAIDHKRGAKEQGMDFSDEDALVSAVNYFGNGEAREDALEAANRVKSSGGLTEAGPSDGPFEPRAVQRPKKRSYTWFHGVEMDDQATGCVTVQGYCGDDEQENGIALWYDPERQDSPWCVGIYVPDEDDYELNDIGQFATLDQAVACVKENDGWIDPADFAKFVQAAGK